jgi:hypothetical protein
MKRIIKITDVESGKELEIAEKLSNINTCLGCYYYNNPKCPDEEAITPICNDLIIFKEVINKKQEDEKH